jgi:hypothetical protein
LKLKFKSEKGIDYNNDNNNDKDDDYINNDIDNNLAVPIVTIIVATTAVRVVKSTRTLLTLLVFHLFKTRRLVEWLPMALHLAITTRAIATVATAITTTSILAHNNSNSNRNPPE